MTTVIQSNRYLMAQDYAKLRNRPAESRNGRTRSATRAAPPPSTHWSWYFAGVFSGLFAVFIGYAGMTNFYNPAESQAEPPATVLSEADLPTFNFGFYDELANASVEVAGTQNATTTPAAALAAGNTAEANSAAQPADLREYLLQAGSFQAKADAENRRAKIILLNMNANVVPGVVSGRTWMRVQVGPFQGRESADAARAILSENNIDSIPLIVR